MEILSYFARSMNETHRICTHDISGHLHLIRFCIDELLEEFGPDHPMLNKLEEGVDNIEELNKRWKVCTRFLNPEDDLDFASICEKAIGLAKLYNQKFIEEISYTKVGDFELPLEKAVILIESIYAATSIMCHFASLEQKKTLSISVTGENSTGASVILCGNINKVRSDEIDKLLSDGNENDKTLRRFMGAKLPSELGGSFEYELKEEEIIIRIKL